MEYDGKHVYDTSGYPTISINNKTLCIHVLEWERYNGQKPEGMKVHHIDFDKSNWHIKNLQLVTPSEHRKIHAGWVKENGEWTKKLCKGCNRILSFDKFWKINGRPCHKCAECLKKTDRKRIVPNEKGEYRCIKCNQWKNKKLFALRKGEVKRSICKKCCNNERKENYYKHKRKC